MVEVSTIRAVLFAKDLGKVQAFYTDALGMTRREGDENHAVLDKAGFELIVHQIPQHIASGIEIAEPPRRREAGAVRLDYPVSNVQRSRSTARALGGDIDEDPPPWADRGTNFFLGYDPEGNVIGVSQAPD